MYSTKLFRLFKTAGFCSYTFKNPTLPTKQNVGQNHSAISKDGMIFVPVFRSLFIALVPTAASGQSPMFFGISTIPGGKRLRNFCAKTQG